jgi:hypothetical protein
LRPNLFSGDVHIIIGWQGASGAKKSIALISEVQDSLAFNWFALPIVVTVTAATSAATVTGLSYPSFVFVSILLCPLLIFW